MILLSQLAPSDHLLGNEKQAADHLISCDSQLNDCRFVQQFVERRVLPKLR
jgi:hypothetical protein